MKVEISAPLLTSKSYPLSVESACHIGLIFTGTRAFLAVGYANLTRFASAPNEVHAVVRRVRTDAVADLDLRLDPAAARATSGQAITGWGKQGAPSGRATGAD